MDLIKVTCAIITFQNKILAVQRSKRMSMPMKWEFPGGKIEAGETEVDCIKREIKEEININIEVLERLTPSIYNYPTFKIELIPFTANYLLGELKLKEHHQYVLLEKNELNTLDWAEADLPIVEEVMKLDY